MPAQTSNALYIQPRALTPTEVCKYIGGCSRSHLDNLRKHPKFPKPRSLGGQRIIFFREEIDAYLDGLPAVEIGDGHRAGALKVAEAAPKQHDSA